MQPVKHHRSSKWHNWDSASTSIVFTLIGQVNSCFVLWYPCVSRLLMTCPTSTLVHCDLLFLVYLPCSYFALYVYISCFGFPCPGAFPCFCHPCTTVLALTQDLQMNLWHWNFFFPRTQRNTHFQSVGPGEILAFELCYLQNVTFVDMSSGRRYNK